MDAISGVTEFLRITTKEHDRKFLYHIKLPANSFIVFDKGYYLYNQIAKWTSQKNLVRDTYENQRHLERMLGVDIYGEALT